MYRIHARFCYEKEGDVENKSCEGDSSGKTGYATAEASHGHFTDMSEEAEKGGDSGEAESNDVEYEDISEPFDDDLGYLDGGCVADQGVYIFVGR